LIKPSKYVEELTAYKITPQDVWSDSLHSDILKLDWNESTIDFPFYKDVLIKLSHEKGLFSWYPDYLSIDLNIYISHYNNVSVNNVLSFPGSDVALETICRCYLEPNDEVVVVSPTYDNFYVYAAQVGAKINRIDWVSATPPTIQDFSFFQSNIEKAKLVYLVSPNNPIGYDIDILVFEALLQNFPDILFVIDEAYVEFSSRSSLSFLTARYNNLVVVRTFSKAFGLAGIRLGYVVANLEIINTLYKIRNGKNISMISQRLGVAALKNINVITSWIDEVKKARSFFEQWCINNNIVYYPSQGNFILFFCADPDSLCSFLKSHGIYIRNRNAIIKGSVRVTIGSIDNVKRIVNLLEIFFKI